MEMTKAAILPAAGMATRMRGLPKFLLPSRAVGKTLIEMQIELLTPYVSRIVVPYHQSSEKYLASLGLPESVEAFQIESKTMVETTLEAIKRIPADLYFVGMPDTDFIGANPYEMMNRTSLSSVALWTARSSQKAKVGMVEVQEGKVISVLDKPTETSRTKLWGALSITSSDTESIDPKSETLSDWMNYMRCLRAVDIKGHYFDCGTHGEYLEYIRHDSKSKEST